MSFERPGPGLIEVRYLTEHDMLPAQQEALMAAMDLELGAGHLTLLFRVASAKVPRIVPEFWLQYTTARAPRLRAMAIVSDSFAVRAAATSFGVANMLRGIAIKVKTFKNGELEVARLWCKSPS